MFTCVYLAVSSEELLRGQTQKKITTDKLSAALGISQTQRRACTHYEKGSDGCPAKRRRISAERSASQHS